METQPTSATVTAMPETDWLTGLASRAAFGRLVGQADRDRDRFAIALIEIDDFGEINRQLDYETGDDLLRTIGQALAFHTSVDTVAARLGGAQFGILTVHRDARELQSWVGPIVAAVKAAIATWTFDLIDLSGECGIEPDLRVGAAWGYSDRVWVDAANALDIAQTDSDNGTTVFSDPEDPRVVARERRQALADLVTGALDDGRLGTGGHRIDVVGASDPDWRWLRLGALQPEASRRNRGQADSPTRNPKNSPQNSPRNNPHNSPHSSPTRPQIERRRDSQHQFRDRVSLIDTSLVPAKVERRLEWWLVEQAGQILAETGDQLRLTVPVARELIGGRAFAQRLFHVLERFRIPPSRMLFEIDETVFISAGSAGRDFVRQLDRIGSGVVIANGQGGWQACRAVEGLPILYIKPSAELVERAAKVDAAAIAVLSTIITTATTRDSELIAPAVQVPDLILRELGFTYREQIDPEVSAQQSLSPDPTVGWQQTRQG